jgi:superfamily II DNA or RNA helicase/HKD family nuclease/SOS-response transcriptional repressor LexA
MDNLIKVFTSSLETGFINKSILSNFEFQPELLVNQTKPNKKILTNILYELEYCNEFYISVAFVTTSGVASIINKLQELQKRKTKGKVLVSQYLNFTEPEALKRLLQFDNIDLRITTKGNSHAKGYIFKKDNLYNLIIGSSNLTAQALSINKEWNLKVSAMEESSLVGKVLDEFNNDFKNATKVTPNYISSYEQIYRNQFLLNTDKKLEDDYRNEIVTPNSMQLEALGNLSKLRDDHKNKALIISATGTGKTFLSAFDAKAFGSKKLLFVVHRLTIAKESLKSFQRVFGSERTMGLYSGDKREVDSDFLFSTIQTISKEEHLGNFKKDHFDYIIIDETHRSGADSYLRLLKYFEPKFLLGMTATPERTDGNDIFKLFDHNIAYEIRLHRAMEEQLLCDFHYFGVTDLYIDNKAQEDKSYFNRLISNERVERIIEKSRFYGCDNGITRGLVFCSRTSEAQELARLFNDRGLNSIALTGDDSEEERIKAIDLLESDMISKKLDYIFTVDIFNEGIDIPRVNQIIMLRPTDSSIVFIQQLGRGLRKLASKNYLTIIDFIGNYNNNYLIPIALYGDTSYNKDSLRKLITDGSRSIPGASTINFDEISKNKIFQSIDSSNLQLFADLKKDYKLLKYKLGRFPMMMDFVEHGSRDPFQFVSYSNSYFNFVSKLEKELVFELSKNQISLLELFSKEINNSKRIDENIILKLLLSKKSIDLKFLNEEMKSKYGYEISEDTFLSCLDNLNFKFVRKELEIIVNKETDVEFSKSFEKELENEVFNIFLNDSLNYSINSFNKRYVKNLYKDGFILYEKYSRKDVCRILNWKLNEEATVYGYKLNNNSCPIFVNYHKEEKIASSTKFPEKFLNSSQFLWYSKPNRKLSNSTLQSIKNNKEIRLPFFMKKHNGEGSDFYFMGDVSPLENSFEETTIKNDQNIDVPVVKVILELSSPVENSIYNYLTNINSDEFSLEQIYTNNIVNFEEKVNNPIPLYDFYAAAGTFSEMQSNNEYTIIEGPKNLNFKKDLFACKIIGESMNRVIPNGSICLFEKYEGGSRNGKIVLVENLDFNDQDYNSAFTVKTYSSEKHITENDWLHTSIVLRPNSYDPSFQNIVIDESNAKEMRIVGVFVQILE